MKKFEEIFLKVFTQESNLKSTVANTDRYKRICGALWDPLTFVLTLLQSLKIFFFSFNQMNQEYTCFIFPCANLFQICDKS